MSKRLRSWTRNPIGSARRGVESARCRNQYAVTRALGLWGSFPQPRRRLRAQVPARAVHLCQQLPQSHMTPVGFEPTQFALVELESTPLDHSGKVSTAGTTKIVVTTSGTDFSLQIHENRASPCINPPSPQQSGSKRDADKKAEGKRPKQREKEAAEKMVHKQPKKETNAQRRDSWAGPLCGLRPPSLLLDSRAEDTRGQHAHGIQLAESDPVAL